MTFKQEKFHIIKLMSVVSTGDYGDFDSEYPWDLNLVIENSIIECCNLLVESGNSACAELLKEKFDIR